jgi:hypothetical protein
MFGLSEIREREIGKRDVAKKGSTSSVWFEKRKDREKVKTWDPHVFHFSAQERRKSREMGIYSNFTFLPISSSWVIPQNCIQIENETLQNSFLLLLAYLRRQSFILILANK